MTEIFQSPLKVDGTTIGYFLGRADLDDNFKNQFPLILFTVNAEPFERLKMMPAIFLPLFFRNVDGDECGNISTIYLKP